MKWFKLAGLFSVIVGIGIFLLMPADPAKSPPRIIRIKLGQTVTDFMAANDLKEGPGGPREYTIDIDKHDDWMSFWFRDVWVAVHYEDGDFSLDLPPGRVLQVGQSGGVITDFDASLHAQPYPFAEADRLARAFIDKLLKSGWRAQSLFYPKNAEDNNSTSNRKYYATLISASGNKLKFLLTDLALDPPITPSDPTPRFQAHVEIRAPDELVRKRDDFLNARRFALTGRKMDRLGLRIWMDDPDWTPDKLGMKKVDVPNTSWNPEKPWLSRKIIQRWQMPDGTTEP